MMSKIFSTISLVSVVALIGYEHLQVSHTQQQMKSFVSAGPRFTAQDGQELCERVKAPESFSYGYRDAGKQPLDCRYGQKGDQ